MKHCRVAIACVTALTLFTAVATAQGPRGPSAAQPGPGFRAGPGGQQQHQQQKQPGQGHPQGFLRMPLMTALDTDGDGELSANEIRRAVVALRALDKNRDGKVTRDELQPKQGAPGLGGPESGSFQDIFGNAPAAGGAAGGEGAGAVGHGAAAGPGSQFADKIMGFDRNGDGKISANELPPQLPPQMRQFISRGDVNRDGAIDAEEAANIGKHFMKAMGGGMRGGGGGGGGGFGGAGGGGRGVGGGGVGGGGGRGGGGGGGHGTAGGGGGGHGKR